MPNEKIDVKPSDALAAAFVSDPRYSSLIGEVLRDVNNWGAVTPEVGYGQFQGAMRVIRYLEDRGNAAAIEILRPPTKMPEGYDPESYADPDGVMDVI